jgi:hypothetical protein
MMSPERQALAEHRFQVMLHGLKALNVDDTRPSHFTNVLVGLGMELYHAFKELNSGIREKILSRAALAARNLLELRYWTMFAAASEENIWRIRKDALVDGRDMLDRFRTACQTNAELAPALPYLHQFQDWFEDQCRKSGESADGPYLRVTNLAQQFGLSDEHRTMSSFLSKLIHPTGLTICMPGTSDVSFPPLYAAGCWYFNDSFQRLNGTLKGLNLPHLE